MDEDLDARISLEAERAERELISGYIRDWLNKRLRSHFPGFEASVQWEDRAAVYGAWGRCVIDGKVFSVKISLRPEDVMDSSKTTREWSEFLDTQTDLLKRNLQSALWKAGVAPWDLRRISRTATGGGWTEFNYASNRTYDQGIERAILHERLKELEEDVLEKQVAEAIESIKRTSGGDQS